MATSITDQIRSLGEQTLKELNSVDTLDAIEQIRLSVLGKKGKLSEVLKKLGEATAAERPVIGAEANAWKSKIEEALLTKTQAIKRTQIAGRLLSEKIDVTLPSRQKPLGSLHPITLAANRIVTALKRLGFDVATGPEVETEYLNFDAINIPATHPARDMQDTFFMGPGVVLRTHTSPVQIRAMRAKGSPTRVLCLGAVYRCDQDATHSPMFHQVEGLWIDRKVTMSELKGTLEFLAKEVFGSDSKIRLRPSYFSFVEPGAEVDVSCMLCKGDSKKKLSCRICKQTGWLEILGAGMVHPKLYDAAGLKRDEVQGFAFGVGIERVAMLLYGIPDIKLHYQSDIRYLRQFV